MKKQALSDVLESRAIINNLKIAGMPDAQIKAIEEKLFPQTAPIVRQTAGLSTSGADGLRKNSMAAIYSKFIAANPKFASVQAGLDAFFMASRDIGLQRGSESFLTEGFAALLSGCEPSEYRSICERADQKSFPFVKENKKTGKLSFNMTSLYGTPSAIIERLCIAKLVDKGIGDKYKANMKQIIEKALSLLTP